ncbi:MAG: hypothetical protein R3B93_01440 [Bacteroidia bacterium]
MNKILSIFAMIILISSCGTSKKAKTLIENQNTIRIDFNNYLEAITNKEFSKSMDYIVPEFFEIFPKEQMIKVMEQTFNNPEMEFELKEPKILEIGKIKKVNERFYSKLRYSNLMNMKFKGEEEETEEEKKMRNNLMKLSFEQTFGSENVEYNSEADFFQIYSEKEVIAISDNGKTEWKFLVVEEKQKFILEKLVPEEVIKMK